MALYGGFVPNSNTVQFAPTATVANWVLQSVAGTEAFIKEVTFGGQITTSTAMQTRLARDSAFGTGARTAGAVQNLDMHSPANGCFFSSTVTGGNIYATLQPTIVLGCVFGTSWNAHGGVIRWLADPSYMVSIYDAGATTSSIECRADIGSATSSYSVIWQEP